MIENNANSQDLSINKPEADKAYKYLFEISNLDLTLMSNRSNIFLLLQGVLLAIATISFKAGANPFIIVLCFWGLIISLFGWRITKGASFWVSHWEAKMKDIEQQVLGDNIRLFRDHPHMTKDDRLKAEFKEKGYVSTRKSLIYFSFFSIIIWLFLFIYYIIDFLAA